MPSAAILQVFEHFREDIDDANDRRERLIKASRDVTNISKKAIFLLHRLILEDSGDERALACRAASEGRAKLAESHAIFARMRPELVGDRFWRHHRQVSPGLQEYIEALSFAHYLEQGTLISYAQVQAALSDADGPFFTLPVADYLLGLSDLTGELMRFAISNLGRRSGRTKANEVCAFVRNCKADFELFTPHVRDLCKKQQVTASSLEKIEAAAYTVVVRGSEYDLAPEALDDIVARASARFNDHDSHQDNVVYNDV